MQIWWFSVRQKGKKTLFKIVLSNLEWKTFLPPNYGRRHLRSVSRLVSLANSRIIFEKLNQTLKIMQSFRITNRTPLRIWNWHQLSQNIYQSHGIIHGRSSPLPPEIFLSLQHHFKKKLSHQIQCWPPINCRRAFVWEMTYPLES